MVTQRGLMSANKIVNKEMSEELDGDSHSEENGSENEEESSGESADYSCGDDFMNAVNEHDIKKRKLDQDENEDSDNNVADEMETDDHIPSKKKKKKKKLSLADVKPPTAEEMIRLRETENLFHSNLFRMQIEEMIKEVKPKKVERKQMKLWLEKVKELCLNIDDSDMFELDDRCFENDVQSPLPHLPRDETKATSNFQKPISVSVIGSYHAGCCLGPSLSVDVAVIIPKKCFLKEDYLNARYHAKRARYLSRLARVLRDSDLVDKEQGVSWTVHGNVLSPRLVFHPAGKLSKVTVLVSAVPQQGTFKLSRFTPDKNNVRESWLSEGQMEDCHMPSPIYNSSVMRDLVLMSNESVRLQVLENNNNFKDAITLLRVWLRQRHLDLGSGCFSGFLVSMLVVALVQSRRLNSLMSSYQIVRNVWLFLSQSDWTKEGITMCSTKQEGNTPSIEVFHSNFDVVFVDVTGYCNLAADVHRLTYLRVKQEAVFAVQCLDNPDMNSFQALFMVPMPFLHQFDHVVSIKKSKKIIASVLEKESSAEESANHFVSRDMLFTNIVARIINQGVGSRLEQLAYELPAVPPWPITERPPKSQQNLLIGLKLNAETAYSVVEKGPPANEPQAAQFRAMWGSRCELRRFRDGTVCEAVVWAEPTATMATRRLVTRRMVQSLLHDHLGLPRHSTTYMADQLEPLVIEKAFVPDGFEYGSGEEASHAVIQAFDRLSKQLRELSDLPLDVASVQGVSAVFRGAEVFPPLACTGRPQAKAGMQGKTCWLLTDNLGKAPEYIAPVEGVLQLGLSRKWPEDPEAVKRIRAAFNIHIAKALLENCDLQTQAFPDYVDIFKDGFVFRVHVIYPREVVLLKETTTPDGKLCYRDTPEALQLEKYILHLPTLTGALHGLQQQWPGFSVTTRLAKRWLSSQLLDNSHFPDMATELLVASLYLSPEPFRPLAQPQPMFLRFLHLLAHTNWHLEPVIVNFNNDLKRDELHNIESHFRNERASLPPLFIATQYDKTGSVWTKEAPLLPVLVRLASLAKESLTILEANLLSSALLEECKVVFRPPLEIYDVLIRLKPLVLPRFVYGIDFVTNSPLQLKIPQSRRKIPITGFDPAQCYLKELREGYSDYALFFHDTYGGNTIRVLFKPSTSEKHEFKVSHVNCRKPVEVDKKIILEFNLDAIIEDFYVLGAGLVRTIDLSPKYSQKL